MNKLFFISEFFNQPISMISIRSTTLPRSTYYSVLVECQCFVTMIPFIESCENHVFSQGV